MRATSDEERLEAMFRDHYPAVLAYARRRAGAAVADEVAADTFAVAWRRADAIPSDPLPWLIGIARRVLATQRRGDARRVRLARRLQETAASPADDVPSLESPIAEALGGLSANDREAILLIAWEELTVAQAAQTLEISAARFSVRLHRARRRLRHLLQEARNASASPTELASAVPEIVSTTRGVRR